MTTAREAIEAAAQACELEARGYRHAQEASPTDRDKLYRMGQKDACLLLADLIRALPTPAEPEEPTEPMIESGLAAAGAEGSDYWRPLIIKVVGAAMRAARPAGGRKGGA